MSRPFFVLFPTILSLSIVTPILGQTVRGVLINETTSLPVTTGFVVLVGEDSVEQQRTLVDARGSFSFGVEVPGQYALRSQVVGLQSTTSPYFDLRVGQVFEYDFAVPALPIRLNALVVEEERVCRNRSEAGLAATALWNEAQKALNAVIWTEQQNLLRHRLTRYERQLEPVTLDVADEGETWTREGLYQGSPFGSVSADALAKNGYIQDAGSNEWVYHGPDARVLLSDMFANSHCFSARVSRGDQPGLIGLAFEPTEDRDLPDVSGVLWLNQDTGELSFVEYRYTDPPWDLDFSDAGGRIEFEQLATGAWIVKRWWIRMPIIALRPMQTVRIGRQPLDQFYLAGIRETGGWITEVTTLDGQSAGGAAEPLLEDYVAPFSGSSSSAPTLPDYTAGWQIGLNVNLLNTGSDAATFNNAPAFQAALRLSTAAGFQLGGGVQFSRHGITDARQRYTLFQLFTEPRFAIHQLTPTMTPFLGARLGYAWESIADRGATFKSTGLAYGGVVGTSIRLDNRVSLEIGISVGTIKFGDFSATTDRRWEECVLEQGQLGTAMPTTVVACSPPAFWAEPQLTPGTGITGTGDLPNVKYPNTARNDMWRGLWMGFVLRLGSR